MAKDTRKLIFKLRPGDAVIGGHQGAVFAASNDFEKLARIIVVRVVERI